MEHRFNRSSSAELCLCFRVLRTRSGRMSNQHKTLNGARVGDLFMSLIHTCELNAANPFDYLTELLRHAEELKRSPSEWMPWNYRETPARRPPAAAARSEERR